MANQKHLRLLEQGVSVWNQWYREHRNEKIDLSGANLRAFGLGEVKFGPGEIKPRLNKPSLAGANLSGANLNVTNLNVTNLSGADLSGASLAGANLSGANLSGANLSVAMLTGPEDLVVTDLHNADLSKAVLRATNLAGANLRGAKLSGANLRRAKLSVAMGRDDDDLFAANLYEADLSEADLRWADLSGADLRRTNLSQATIGSTIFVNVDLRSAMGLETVRHRSPSTIGLDTIYCSQGQIPDIFLRGAGVDNTFIEYIHELSRHPIEYFTCFISYSSKDQIFAERLHANLQNKGVRCWFAPHDMRTGDKIRDRIDETIHLYDKLLLVLSQYSVASQWVEQEVETALNKERQAQRTVLFPIRLDNTVMDVNGGWPSLIRNTRHIGDFTLWEQHDVYQQVFERLLQDLKKADE